MSSYEVSLVSVSGRTQPVTLKVAKDGLRLFTTEGKELERFPYECIIKWLPAHLRSKNPGGTDCLDIQIETTKGPRDLRMKCESTAMVKQIIKDLRETVHVLMDEMGVSRAGSVVSVDTTVMNRARRNGKQTELDPAISSFTGTPMTAHAYSAQNRFGNATGRMPSVTVDGPGSRPHTPSSADKPGPTSAPAPAPAPTPSHPQNSLNNPASQPPQPSGQQQPRTPTPSTPPASSPAPQGHSQSFIGNPHGQSFIGHNPMGYGPNGRMSPLPERPGDMGMSVQPDSAMSRMTAGYFGHFGEPPGMEGHGWETARGGPAAWAEMDGRYMSAPPMQPAMYNDYAGAMMSMTSRIGSMTPVGMRTSSPSRMSFPPTGPFARKGKENDIMLPGSARKPETGFLMPAGSPVLTDSNSDIRSQLKFLEDMVRRLSHELANNQIRGEPTHDSSSVRPVSPLVPETDVDGVPLPTWLKDQRYLNPLITAYDARITRIQDDLKSKNSQLEKLQQQVNEVVGENEKLRAEAVHNMELLERRVVEGGVTGPEQAQLLERLDLLMQENELLVQQHEEMEKEINRLQSVAERSTHEKMRMVSEQTSLSSQMLSHQQEVQEMETKLKKAQAQLTKSQAHSDELEEQLADAKIESSRLRADAARAKHALEEAQRQQSLLQSDLNAVQSQTRVVADSQSSMQVELSTIREKYEAAQQDALNARNEAEQLRNALTSIESRLEDYQRKDAEVYNRIKDAMEMAEEAKLARDSVLARQRELERECEALQQRLATQHAKVKEALESEFKTKILQLKTEVEGKEAEMAALEQQLAESKAAADRIARDKNSLEAELNGLKSDMGEALAGKSRLSIVSLSAMERVQELERERDEAVQTAESVHRSSQRSQREWQLERQQLETDITSLKKKLIELESGSSLARSEASSFARQVDNLLREVATLKAAKSQQEEEVRARLALVQAEKDAEVKALAAKLEGALHSANRSVMEAEKMLDQKEALLARWREEAQLIASKLDRALTEHKRELEAKQVELTALRQRCDALQVDNSGLAEEVAALRGAHSKVSAALEESERRNAASQSQLIASTQREEELQQEARNLSMQLGKVKLDKARSERSKPTFSALGALGSLGRRSSSGDGSKRKDAELNGNSALSPKEADNPAVNGSGLKSLKNR